MAIPPARSTPPCYHAHGGRFVFLNRDTMTGTRQNRDGTAHYSWAGIVEGARLAMPVMPGMVLFGAAFGALAAEKGLSLLEATLMSTIAYAGASQFVALGMWPDIA